MKKLNKQLHKTFEAQIEQAYKKLATLGPSSNSSVEEFIAQLDVIACILFQMEAAAAVYNVPTLIRVPFFTQQPGRDVEKADVYYELKDNKLVRRGELKFTRNGKELTNETT